MGMHVSHRLIIVLRFETFKIPGYDPTVKEHKFAGLRDVLSDFTIICEDETEILVHRSVLAMHSDVFSAMLSHECAENKEGNFNTLDLLISHFFATCVEKMLGRS